MCDVNSPLPIFKRGAEQTRHRIEEERQEDKPEHDNESGLGVVERRDKVDHVETFLRAWVSTDVPGAGLAGLLGWRRG